MKSNLACLIFFILFSLSSYGQKSSNTAIVDPNIGGVGLILEPTRPTVQLPNQMIRSYPGRKDYIDPRITTFPLSLISHRNGQLFGLMPFTGQAEKFGNNPSSTWDPENEIATPYYYSEWLEDFDTKVEFTPGAKAGYFRITFPGNAEASLFLRIINKGKWTKVTSTSVEGTESFQRMNAWVYGEFSQDFQFIEKRTGENSQAILSWPANAKTIEFRYAISYISAEQARKNLKNEIAVWDFESLKSKAQIAWDKVLNQIEVSGGTDARKRTFYTALYRCYERMVNITEDGKYYSNYNKQVNTDSRPFYVDDWIWDTYLALHPLRLILNPDLEADMVNSYVKMYEQSGWLPTFPVLWGDNPCMNGFHSTITILDTYRKGVRNFDVSKAYEAMKKNSLQATMLPWKNGPACSLDTFYYKNGFYPGLHPDEKETVPQVHGFEKRQSVAITLGHSYDDWALAEMAKELKNNADYEFFRVKAQSYKNLYWKEKGFFMPKDKDGNWISIDPVFDGGMGGRDYYDENNGWTYLWQVQQDVPSLMELMGGKKTFENRLDQLFSENLGRNKYATWAKFPDFTGIVGQFSMGNEPSFHIPYLYNFTESPWKTQKRIRMLLNTWFPDNIFGIPGDEDGGGMSAFVVFSCMGFYPVTPGVPLYTIGSPVFEKIKINLPNGKTFTVNAPGCSEKNKFIQEAYLNGKAIDSPWFSHEDLMKGGELKLVMGPLPNKNWGKSASVPVVQN